MSGKDGIAMGRADAMRLWHRVNLGSVRADNFDLTSRQMAILTTVYLEPAPHTVRSLASRLNVTKAVITRALNTMSRFELVTRDPDPRDKRSVCVKRTAFGSRYLSNFAERITVEGKGLGSSANNSAIRVA